MNYHNMNYQKFIDEEKEEKEKENKREKKKIIIILVTCFLITCIIITIYLITGRKSAKVSRNVSLNADNFNVVRRVTIINTITDKIEFEAVGRISIDSENSEKLIILAKTSENEYKKHIVNMTELNMYVVEDLYGAKINDYKYEVNYMPKNVVPIEIKEVD